MHRIWSRLWRAGMSSDAAFLEAAAAIARRIVADAVWDDGRCSWVGAVMDAAQRSEYRALGPNVHGGTAGIGLFLAQLAAVTGGEDFHRTAVGALRHAIARAPAMPLTRRDGFHAGSVGIAWAADRSAALLGEEELREGARSVLTQERPVRAPDRCPDIAMGGAGSIVGLLALADALDDPRLKRDAVTVGEELIGGATRTRHGWSWASPGRRYPQHLCGLSHGAAGIGWALVELFAATGDERFRAGATGAFAYERSWLDTSSGMWPDLRIGGQRRQSARRIPAPGAGSWCHGEAGIALTRMRAMALCRPDGSLDDAEIALETTRRLLAEALPHVIEDLSLCHGAAGAADVLLCGVAALGERWREGADLSLELGRVALERHGATGNRWPCGARGGTTPGLFRGLSGIAWWFLRLHDHAVPSPLTIPSLQLTAALARA
jgi:lantibiotic modifying enzyme